MRRSRSKTSRRIDLEEGAERSPGFMTDEARRGRERLNSKAPREVDNYLSGVAGTRAYRKGHNLRIQKQRQIKTMPGPRLVRNAEESD